MKVLKEKLNVIEFELDNKILKLSLEFITLTHNEFELYTKNKAKIVNYGIRFSTLITNKKDNKKVLIYKSEWSAELHLENAWIDDISLYSFVKNGFIEHEEYFLKNKPDNLNVTKLYENKPIESFTSSIFSQLKKNGLYKL